MYIQFKSLLATVACATLLATNGIAQTTKKTTKPAPAAPKAVAASTTPQMKTPLDSVAYSIGISIAGSLQAQGLSNIDTDLLLRALRETLSGGTLAINAEQANEVIANYFQKQTSEKSRENKDKGAKFLEENKKRAGIQTTASGLQYEVIKMGEGAKPLATDRVKTHYHGTLVDGTVFDSSVDRGEPVEFPVNGVIQGWQEALQLMPVGSKWKLYLPSELAYGERAAGPTIGPHSALVFTVELLEILK
jgi:FKBP-type peptidyl-prolyl cis-trans isomerase FklB